MTDYCRNCGVPKSNSPSIPICRDCESALHGVCTGDKVYHYPTGEEWMVAFVQDDQIIPCGWPLSYAQIMDCRLVSKASEKTREELIRDMANMPPDPRKAYAMRMLELGR